jgi:hypothetical protein
MIHYVFNKMIDKIEIEVKLRSYDGFYDCLLAHIWLNDE